MEIEKSARLLYLYQDFIKGAGIQKKAAADRFGVNERSLQRDIEDLRCFFANQTPPGEIIYDARQKVYRLVERDTAHPSNSEVLAVCKTSKPMSRSVPASASGARKSGLPAYGAPQKLSSRLPTVRSAPIV